MHTDGRVWLYRITSVRSNLCCIDFCGSDCWTGNLERAGFQTPGKTCCHPPDSAILALVYWNHPAWIAERNIARYELTGALDLRYLAIGLGPDAVPELTQSLASWPRPSRHGCVPV